METLLYLARINMFLVIFYASYWLLFRKHTFFAWNRFYLLGGLIFSAILPSIKFTKTYQLEIPSTTYNNQALKVAAISNRAMAHSTDWAMVMIYVYAAGIMLMLSILLISFYKLFTIIKQSERVKTDQYTLILLDRKIGNTNRGPYSFFNWLMIAREDYEHNPDVILRHEHVHISQFHSVDIILVELFKVFFWFNPVVWFYKNALQATHEFLADQEVSDREHYARFLVSYALNSPKPLITNQFFNSSLLKSRIQMIYKNRSSRWLLGKYALIIPITILTVFLTAARERIAEEPMLVGTIIQEDLVNVKGAVIDQNGKTIPDAIVILAGTTKGVPTDKDGTFEFRDAPVGGKLVITHVNFKAAEILIERDKTFYGITLLKNEEIISGTVAGNENTKGKFMNYNAGKPVGAGKSEFKVSESKPQFPGGQTAMIAWLKENMRYPERALRVNVEGIVLVQFTVNKEGKIGDVALIKGIGFGADWEAVNLVKKMPDWKPAIQNGKPIAMTQAIEIKFDLEEGRLKTRQGMFLEVKQAENLFTMDDLGKRFNKFFDFASIEDVPKPVKSDTAKTYYTNYRYTPYKIATPGFTIGKPGSSPSYKYQKP